jgi:putative ABC transport system substrate-binding protein
MAAELVRSHVAVIAATSTPAALAAKSATATIPIVFETASDPVRIGLVASLNRPGGNITGVTQLNVEVAPKRLELLHELVPKAKALALLVNPVNAVLAETQSKDLLSAAGALGLELHFLNASSERDFDDVFSNVIRLRVGGLVISSDPLFTSWTKHLATLAARHEVPAAFARHEFTASGGLLSYGTDAADAYRLAGIYTGRILKGEKPADLAIQQSTKVELSINLKTAKALGITIPPTLLARADEVIE